MNNQRGEVATLAIVGLTVIVGLFIQYVAGYPPTKKEKVNHPPVAVIEVTHA